MKSKKSCGYDGIHTNIAKLSVKEISKPLTHIFSLTFSTGIIPDNLKVAIFKCNDAMKFEVRPISVLVCFSKLLERLMINRLSKFIDKNKILSKHQYGFRKNRSTEHAIIDFVDKITKAIDEGKYSVGIFLDLSKVFDTINHRILIKKLEHYGIRGVAKKWFENYLCNIKQIVKYNDVQSEVMTIRSGVPQGSVLGPLLFLLYINDIQFCSELISIVLFADDTNILFSHTCLKQLNEVIQIEMNKIIDWLNANKLSINTEKTKFILFRSKNKKLKDDIKISINNESIKQVKNTTFLGIVIDECLTW
jgi:retron-type reverse transcriptase